MPPGRPGLATWSTVKYLGNTGFGFPISLGDQLRSHDVHVVKGRYRSTIQGMASVIGNSTFYNPSVPTYVGLSTLCNLMDEDGNDVQLPAGAIIRDVLIDVVTTFNASSNALFNSPSIFLGVNTDRDLLAPSSYTVFAQAINPSTALSVFKGIPQVDHAATYVKVRNFGSTVHPNATVVTMNMTGGSLITGDMNVFIEYYLSD